MIAARKHLPGEPGIWVFVFGDLVIFGLFFLTFMAYRAQDPALYRQAQATMNQALGGANTLLLLTGSWFVAAAVQWMRRGEGRAATRLTGLAMLCGGGFVAIKAVEWGTKIAAGTTMLTNDFYMFYFMFTGIHLVHVLIGIGVLGLLFTIAGRASPQPSSLAAFEAGAIFWHLIDLLWIMLFALFYLI